MIDLDSTKLSIYEYFKKCSRENSYYRGVGVITNKQMVYYSQTKDHDIYDSHFDLAQGLESAIYPDDKRDFYQGDYKNDVFLFSVGNSLSIDLPDNGLLSKMQADFLLNVIDQVEKVNSEIEDDRKKIYIDFFAKSEEYLREEVDKYDFDRMRQIIIASISDKIYFEKEEIIGKTQTHDEVINSIKYHLSKIEIIKAQDLSCLRDVMFQFYDDDYYKQYILEIFPNCKEIINLMNMVMKFDIEMPNFEIENISDFLSNIVHHLFDNIHSFESFKVVVGHFFNKNETQKDMEKYYPYFTMVVNLIYELFYDNVFYSFIQFDGFDEYEMLFKNVHGYQDILNIMPVLINKLIAKKEQELDGQLQIIRRNEQVKLINEHKDEIDKIIAKKKELNELIHEIYRDDEKIIEESIEDMQLLDKLNQNDQKRKGIEELIEKFDQLFVDLTHLEAIYACEGLIHIYYDEIPYDVDYTYIDKLKKDIQKWQKVLEMFNLDNKNDLEEEMISNKKK